MHKPRTRYLSNVEFPAHWWSCIFFSWNPPWKWPLTDKYTCTSAWLEMPRKHKQHTSEWMNECVPLLQLFQITRWYLYWSKVLTGNLCYFFYTWVDKYLEEYSILISPLLAGSGSLGFSSMFSGVLSHAHPRARTHAQNTHTHIYILINCTWPVQKVSDLLPDKNIFTRLEVCNPSKYSLLVTGHTSPSGSAIVRSISGMSLCEWATAWPSCSV